MLDKTRHYDNRSLRIDFPTMPLSDQTGFSDPARLNSFSGVDAISEPFEYSLELRINDDRGVNLEYESVIGQPATVTLDNPRGTDYFNGIITSFGPSDPGVYLATLRPNLWKLTLTNKFILYNDKTRNLWEMVYCVLERNQIDCDITRIDKAKPHFKRKQDWLQAGETDFEFISRLMRKAGLFYYFVHGNENGHFFHRMILANDALGYEYKSRDNSSEKLEVRSTFTDEESLDQDLIFNFSYQETLAPTSMKTWMTSAISAWDTSSAQPIQKVDSGFKDVAEKSPAGQDLKFERLTVVPFDVGQEEAEYYRDETRSRIQSSSKIYSGTSNCAQFSSGKRFWVTKSKREELNREYVITRVEHSATVENDYSNSFEAVLPEYIAIPFEPEEAVPETIFATVVQNPSAKTSSDPKDIFAEGALIHDQFYYDEKKLGSPTESRSRKGIYVQFPWDDSGGAHWVQLSNNMLTIPEENSTVTIEKARDNSELPEVTGIVRADGAFAVTPESKTYDTFWGTRYSYMSGDSYSVTRGNNDDKHYGNNVSYQEGNNDSVQYGDNSNIQYGDSTSEQYGDNDNKQIGDSTQYQEGDSTSEQHGDNVNKHYGNAEQYQEGNSVSTQIGNNANTHQGNSTQYQMGNASNQHIGNSDTFRVGADSTMQVGTTNNIFVGITSSIHVGANFELNASANLKITASANINISASVDLDIVKAFKFELKGGSIEKAPTALTNKEISLVREALKVNSGYIFHLP